MTAFHFTRLVTVRRSRMLLWLAAGALLIQTAAYGADNEMTPSQNQPAEFASIGTSAPGEPPTKFVIDPKTPVRALLPAAPKTRSRWGPLLTEDLAKVPEVAVEEPLPSSVNRLQAVESVALLKSKILFLNSKNTDGFMAALLARRGDLKGLPVALGDACRLTAERAESFRMALDTLREAQAHASGGHPSSGVGYGSFVDEDPKQFAETFWERYSEIVHHEDKDGAPARVAALMQVLTPKSEPMRLGLIKQLAGVLHADSTRALARLAIFSGEESVRQAAIEALKVRRERDYNDILRQGLRYPYPPVARRTTEALVKLERIDWVPELIDFLDEPDPRVPVVKTVNKKSTSLVRELVRINHLRNCLLCHAPGQSTDSLTTLIPIPVVEPCLCGTTPQQPHITMPDLSVRFDVTYLRQDFSLMQRVGQAAGSVERFDFLVRSRALSDQEAAIYREALAVRGAGVQSPYHRAALAALRELTGRDTAPSAAAWRALLHTPTREW